MKLEFDTSMNCEDVNELLSQFLFEELELNKQKRIQKHLLSCESCSVAFFDLIESSLQSGELPLPSIPPPPSNHERPMYNELAVLQQRFAPGIDNASHENELLLEFEIPLARLAAAPHKTEEHHLDISKVRDDNFIQSNQNGFIITLWEIQEENVTIIGVKVESDLRPKFEDCLVIITDGHGKLLLQGRIGKGEISEELQWQLADIASPLKIRIERE